MAEKKDKKAGRGTSPSDNSQQLRSAANKRKNLERQKKLEAKHAAKKAKQLEFRASIGKHNQQHTEYSQPVIAKITYEEAVKTSKYLGKNLKQTRSTAPQNSMQSALDKAAFSKAA